MRPLSLTFGASLLPGFSLVAAANTGKDCHGKICHPVNEYCSAFHESCYACSEICNTTSHNYQADMCAKECSEYNKYEPLKADIQNIQSQQRLILILLIILLVLIVIRYSWKCLRWLRQNRCLQQMLKKLKPKSKTNANAVATISMQNGQKDLNAITIQNRNAINSDIERAPSQIYSATGAAEGSVLTVTTPVSTRYPAENSTTPTTIATEYSYDNQALAITPVTEKPRNQTAF